MPTQSGDQPKDNAGARQDREPYWKSSDADTNWIMAVHIEGLSGPEHEDAEEVGAADEGDDERQGEDAGVLSQTFREHGVLCAIGFPQEETDDQDHAQDERGEHMSAGPGVLISTPLQTHHEEQHPRNTQKAADVVDL